jgi:S-adenosylmethionine hydrolase
VTGVYGACTRPKGLDGPRPNPRAGPGGGDDPTALIIFSSDFGPGPYPGICRGVIKRIAPACEILDLTHDLPALQPRAAAVWLAAAAPYLPVAVHLSVVDPGVGGTRRPVVVRCRRGDLLVGPDNGLLSLAWAELGGAVAAWRLDNPAWRLAPVSATFHGRDVFAPAAAHLALGEPPEAAGPEVGVPSLQRVGLPAPHVSAGRLEAEVLTFDPFGSALLAVRAAEAQAAGLRAGRAARVGGRPAVCVTTFAEAPADGLCLLPDSSGWLLLAVREGNAREVLGLRVGARVVVET